MLEKSPGGTYLTEFSATVLHCRASKAVEVWAQRAYSINSNNIWHKDKDHENTHITNRRWRTDAILKIGISLAIGAIRTEFGDCETCRSAKDKN